MSESSEPVVSASQIPLTSDSGVSAGGPLPGTPPPVWVKEARLKRGIEDDNPVAGLALSGGGIRSATFSLGLIRALAQSKVFNRFDYLSTVSGGGYAGAAVGKLFNPDPTAQAVRGTNQQAQAAAKNPNPGLAGMDASWFIWWLRATSRYLTPRGFTDIVRALATYLRSMLGVHFEAAVMGLAVGCLMALYNLLIWKSLALLPALHAPVKAFAGSWISSWWLLAFIPVTAALIKIFAYWQVRREGTDSLRRRVDTSCFAFLLVVLLQLLWHERYAKLVPIEFADLRFAVYAACYLLLLISVAPLIAIRHDRRAGGEDTVQRAAKARNTLTMDLSWWLACLAVLFVLGVLDRVAWWFAFGEAWNWRVTQTAAGIVAASLLVARLTAMATAREVSAESGAASTGANRTMSWIGSLGMLVGFVLLALWVGVAYQWVLGALFPLGLEKAASFGAAAWLGVVLFALLAIYLCTTGSGAGFVNQSSLHMFYRARLARSYLGASNRARFTPEKSGTTSHHPLDPVPGLLRAEGANRKTVYDVDPGDLVALADYLPHEGGGPVHILNMTVNQTVDPAGGLFNQDRKGEYLSVTTGGWSRLGTREWKHEPALAGDDLATWMAVSGAAAAPGLGAQTSKGLALLCFLAGVRLGFWWDSLAGQPHASMAKYKLFLHEMLANFPGASGRYWFLSDGGHFDNTGAYSLLRERAGLIVLADCGADPDYDFKDVENLVRKARIDLHTEIQFLRPTKTARESADLKRFGTLHDLADPGGNECLAIASIHYPDPVSQRTDKDRPADGYLVLVKPNIFHGLPVDILRYKRDNLKFPQETTTDQFFSEAQWESYYRLGAKLGESITPAFLDMLCKPLSPSLFEADLPESTQTSVGSSKEIALAAAAAVTAVREIPLRRERRLRSGLGMTAVLAAILCGGWLWHLYEKHEAQRLEDMRVGVRSVEELYDSAPDSQCPALQKSFVALADEWCEQSGGSAELSKLGGRYEALMQGCGSSNDAGCAKLSQWHVRDCYRGTSAERAVHPEYWALPNLVTTHPAGPARCALGLTQTSPTPTTDSLKTTAKPGSDQSSSVVVAPAPATADQWCERPTIYIHAFGAAETERANSKASKWLENLRIQQYSVEDVLKSAKDAKRKAPITVGKDLILYSDDIDFQCATILWSRIGDDPVVRKQAEELRAKPKVIEVWLKPRP